MRGDNSALRSRNLANRLSRLAGWLGMPSVTPAKRVQGGRRYNFMLKPALALVPAALVLCAAGGWDAHRASDLPRYAAFAGLVLLAATGDGLALPRAIFALKQAVPRLSGPHAFAAGMVSLYILPIGAAFFIFLGAARGVLAAAAGTALSSLGFALGLALDFWDSDRWLAKLRRLLRRGPGLLP